ncbi:MAG: hypothetical protein AAGB02_03165 [Pseudomonadota bacterium]
MVDIRKVASELLIRMRSEGADALADDLREVASAGRETVAVSTKTERITQDLEKAFNKLESRIDPLAKLEKRRADQLALIRRFEAQDVRNKDRVANAIEKVNEAYEQQKRRIEQAASAQGRYNRTQSESARQAEQFRRTLLGAAAAVGTVITLREAIEGVTAALERAENISDRALQVGASVEGLQELRFAADKFGVTQKQIDDGLQRLNRRFGEFVNSGAGPAKAALEALFSEGERAILLSQKTDEAFLTIARRYASIEDPARKAAFAAQLFGDDSGPKLVTLLSQGERGIARYAARARELGIILENDLVGNAASASAEIRTLNQAFSANVTRAVLENAESIERLSRGVANFIPVAVQGTNAALAFFGVLEKSPDAQLTALVNDLNEVESRLAGELSDRQRGVTGFIEQPTLPGFKVLGARLRQGVDVVTGEREKLEIERDRLQAAIADIEKVYAAQRTREILKDTGVANDVERQTAAANAAIDQLAAKFNAFNEELALKIGETTKQQVASARQIVDQFNEAFPDATPEQVAAAELLAGEIEAVTGKLAQLERQGQKTRDAVQRIFDPVGDVVAENKKLEALIAAAKISPEELRRAEQIEQIEERISQIRLEAQRSQAVLSEQQTRDLRTNLQLQKELQSELEARRATFLPSSPADFEPVRNSLAAALIDASQQFYDNVIRTGRFSFKGLGRSLKQELLSGAIAPARAFTANLFAGLSGAAGGVFTPGVAGASPANRATAGGVAASSSNVFQSAFSLPGLVQSAVGLGGLALGGPAASTFGTLALIGPAAVGRQIANIGNAVGLSGGAIDFLAEGLASAATPVNAGLAIGGSLLSRAAFGNSKGQQIGSTVGGIAGNFIPIPFVGPLLGSFLGGTLGSLFSGPPSDFTAGGAFNPATGRVLDAQQDRNSDENAQIRDAIITAASDVTADLIALTGGVLRNPASTPANEAAVLVSVNDKGITVANPGAPGQFLNSSRFSASEAGAEDAIAGAIRLSLSAVDTRFDGIDRYFDRLESADRSVEEIISDTQSLVSAYREIDRLDDAAASIVNRIVDAAINEGGDVARAATNAANLAQGLDDFDRLEVASQAEIERFIDRRVAREYDLTETARETQSLVAAFRSVERLSGDAREIVETILTRELERDRDVQDAAQGASSLAVALDRFEDLTVSNAEFVKRFINNQNGSGRDLTDVASDTSLLTNFFAQIQRFNETTQTRIREFVAVNVDVGKDVDQALDSAAKLANVLEQAVDPVDVFAQRTRDLTAAIDPLIDEMKALGLATADLETIRADGLRQIGEDRNNATRAAYLELTNPLQNEVQNRIDQFILEREGAREALDAGAPVDLSLLIDVQKRSILSLFNIENRLTEAVDPARASLLEVENRQRAEQEALRAAIRQGFASYEDLFALQRAQGPERVAAFNALPEEDQLRLSGQLAGFEDFTGRIGRVITQINQLFDRSAGDFEDYRDRLRDAISQNQRQLTDYDRLLSEFDVAGTPRSETQIIRAQLNDQREIAINGPEEARAAARDNVIRLARELQERTERVNATSPAAIADNAFARRAVQEVRDAIAAETSEKERELALAESTDRTLKDIRALLAAQTVDPVELAQLAASLPEGNELGQLAKELAVLRASEDDQKDRIADVLAVTDPSVAFGNAVALDPVNDNRRTALGVSTPLDILVRAPQGSASTARYVTAPPSNDDFASFEPPAQGANLSDLSSLSSPLQVRVDSPPAIRGADFSNEQVVALLSAIRSGIRRVGDKVEESDGSASRRDSDRDNILRLVHDTLTKREL